MNVLSLIKSLNERATRLEAEAKAIRTEARQLQALVLGEPEEPEEPASPEEEAMAAAPVAPRALPARVKSPGDPQATAMPNRDEIRAKAAEFSVNVDDLLPLGKKPTLQQKQDAMKRIFEAKQAAIAAKTDSTAAAAYAAIHSDTDLTTQGLD